MMRINKYLAQSGIASRRKSEQLVLDGQVKINGRPISDLSYQVKESDIVEVDGERVNPIEEHIYLMLNKPKGHISSTFDERGRKTVMDCLPAYRDKRIFPVGRLDYDTEGLLLLTTDGDFAKMLTHPSHSVPKTYLVKIEGEISEEELSELRNGVVIDGVRTKRCSIIVLEVANGITSLEMTITQGLNRQIRKMFESIEKEITFLKRTAVHTLRLGGLSRGEYRILKPAEISALKTKFSN